MTGTVEFRCGGQRGGGGDGAPGGPVGAKLATGGMLGTRTADELVVNDRRRGRRTAPFVTPGSGYESAAIVISPFAKRGCALAPLATYDPPPPT